VLYTDGLIEDRRNTVDRGLTQLCEAIQSAPTDDPANLVEHILNANVGPSPRSDDVAILALTLLPQPPLETTQLPIGGQSAPVATPAVKRLPPAGT
jgi:hypothetical protein